MTEPRRESFSAAADWPILRSFIGADRRLGEHMAQRQLTAALYEFVRFGVKQAWACLFGGIVVFLLITTWAFYPRDAALSRYDFLFLSMLAVQAVLILTRLEKLDEAKVILIYHVVGTIMEIFKTAVGSWTYPEQAFFRIGGVPLFTGFMYACIGSYLCRVFRLFDFRFTHHPPLWATIALSVAIYANFFAHHYVVDFRLLLFAAAAVLFGRTVVYFKIWRVYRAMPMLLGLMLVSLFIWFAENIGTFTRTWLYPSQLHGWSPVSFAKLGSWFLLLIISYTLVTLVDRPQPLGAGDMQRAGKVTGAGLMRLGRRSGYAITAALLIGVGLLTRWPALNLPAEFAKYAGSAIWGAMVFCVVGAIRPQWPVGWIAGSALLIASATEFSQLLHPEWLDAFRRTTVGVLLLGRFFSWGDIAAYAGGIALASLAACWVVLPSGPSARRG